MFICNATLPYDTDKKIMALSAESYERLRKEVNSEFRGYLPQDPSEFKSFWVRDAVMDSMEVEAWENAGFEVTMKRVRGLYKKHPTADSPIPPTMLQVAVPGLGLLQVNKVHLMEDACTDALQEMLEDGWRILAVCPANDTRRPTYILGRSEP